MPAKKKKLKNYYVISELLPSYQIHEPIKELLSKERATYRMFAPEEAVGEYVKKKAREIIKSSHKAQSIDKDGNVSEIELPCISFDSDSWRYFLNPETLDDLEEFAKLVNFEIILEYFDPKGDEDMDEEWLEEQIGFPLPEDPFVILTLCDAYLMMGGGQGCDDPECDCHLGDDDE